jgi:hypothetical protein
MQFLVLKLPDALDVMDEAQLLVLSGQRKRQGD